MPERLLLLVLLALIPGAVGCGSTKSRLATEQLLVSDAVDAAVSSIDFRALAGENVFLDTRYLVNVKGVGFVNSEYIISSLRQQMVAADVRLKERAEDADFVVEARVGTLGSDGNEIIYGIPANKGLSEASTMMPGAPPLPAIPEISVARKETQLGAVKVAAFAYDRETGSPIWQSGMARTRTTSQDVWLFGAGPFQRGTIHSGMEFAGGEMNFPKRDDKGEVISGPPVAFGKEFYFPRPVGTQVAQNPDATPGAAAAGGAGGEKTSSAAAAGKTPPPAAPAKGSPAPGSPGPGSPGPGSPNPATPNPATSPAGPVPALSPAAGPPPPGDAAAGIPVGPPLYMGRLPAAGPVAPPAGMAPNSPPAARDPNPTTYRLP